MLTKFTLAFLLSLFVIKIMKPLAIHIGLVDKPDERKQHDGLIPLVGGLSIFISMAVLLGIYYPHGPVFYSWLVGAALLVLVGAVDDRQDLSVRLRVLAAIAASLLMIFGAGNIISSLGNLFGLGDVVLPLWAAVPFTTIAVFGVINALNMCDGIDGMAASLALLSLTSFMLITDGSVFSLLPMVVLCAGLCAFLVYNLQLTRKLRKVFLGDAGSMLLGYTLVWILARYSQNHLSDQAFDPVTALFILGLPLIDMVATVVRRVQKGANPFRPDRTHVHHILLHAGFTHRQTLAIVVLVGAVINITGIVLHAVDMPDVIQLAIFCGLFALYYESVQHGFRVSQLLQRLHGSRRAAQTQSATITVQPQVNQPRPELGMQNVTGLVEELVEQDRQVA